MGGSATQAPLGLLVASWPSSVRLAMGLGAEWSDGPVMRRGTGEDRTVRPVPYCSTNLALTA